MPNEKRGAASPDAEQADALALSAEEAEAEAAEAEAVAVAARARAKAVRLRREAEEAEAARERSAADSTAVDAEDDDPDAEAPDVAVEAATTARRRFRFATIAKYAAALVAVLGIAALGTAGGWIVHQHRQAEHQRQLNADFSAAARQGVVSLMSLNYSSAKEDVQRILDNSTGQFKEDFESQAGEFTKVAESSKVVTEASVSATAVKTMTEDNADVLVAANSTITNAQGAKQNPRNWRLVVSMARDGGQIKMAKVEFAP